MNGVILTTKEELSTLIEKSLKRILLDDALFSNKGQEALPEILTIKEACEVLNLAKPTLYAMTSKKVIPFFKRSKKLYFKRSQLVKWIEAGKKGGTK